MTVGSPAGKAQHASDTTSLKSLTQEKGHMTTPNVIIAGAGRCGTTSVFDWLSDHPQVCASAIKETSFFTDEREPTLDRRVTRWKKANFLAHGIEKYAIFFEHCKNKKTKVVLEASPEYLYQRTALEMLPTLEPRPKIIFLLRKPSDRIYSIYQYLQNNLVILGNKISFSEFVNNSAVGSRVKERSIYVKYIPQWINRFARQNICVFLFEDLKQDPKEFMIRVSNCIDIDDTFWEDYCFLQKNESHHVKNQTLHRLIRKAAWYTYNLLPAGKPAPKMFREGPLKRMYDRINLGKTVPKSEDDGKICEALDREFLVYNEELGAVLGIDLSLWGPYSPTLPTTVRQGV